MNQDKQPEAPRLADAIDPFARDSAPDHLTMTVAAVELRRQHARIAELEAELAAVKAAPATQVVEPYAVLVREIGESSFFDSKPIKPGSVQHQHAKSSPHYDYVELYAHPAPQAQDVQRDATRLDWCMNQYGFCYFIAHETGEYCESPQEIRAAIDAAIAASAKGGEA